MRALLLAGLCAGLTLASPAFAGDLTGAYVGKLKCKTLDDTGSKDSSKEEVILYVSQPSGSVTSGDIQAQVILPDLSFFYLFGETFFDGKNPQYGGAGIVHECTHLVTPQTDYMTMHFDYKVKPGDVKGGMKGSIIVDHATDGSKTICKVRFKRVTTMEPNVPFCP